MSNEQQLLEQDQAGRLLLDASELAAMLGISTRTLWRLNSSGRIVKPVKLGGSTRWNRHDIETWVASGCPVVQESEVH